MLKRLSKVRSSHYTDTCPLCSSPSTYTISFSQFIPIHHSFNNLRPPQIPTRPHRTSHSLSPLRRRRNSQQHHLYPHTFLPRPITPPTNILHSLTQLLPPQNLQQRLHLPHLPRRDLLPHSCRETRHWACTYQYDLGKDQGVHQ